MNIIDRVEVVKRVIYDLMPGLACHNVFYEMQNSLLSDSMVEMVGKLLAEHLGMEFIGSGCSRATFLLQEGLVIKLFIGADETDNEQHVQEIKMLLYANKNNVPYAPKLHYFDNDCIVMQYIPNKIQGIFNFEEKLLDLQSFGFKVDYHDLSFYSN